MPLDFSESMTEEIPFSGQGEDVLGEILTIGFLENSCAFDVVFVHFFNLKIY